MFPLEYIFNSPSAKVLDFFIIFREFAYSRDEIIRKFGVNSEDLGPILTSLREKDLIKMTDQGKYQINMGSIYVQGLILCMDSIQKINFQEFLSS